MTGSRKDVRRGHVDLRAQTPLAVRVLSVAHLAEDAQVALGIRVARGRGTAGLLGGAAVFLPLVLREVAAVGLPGLDQVLGDLVHRVEHVRRVVEAGLRAVARARPLPAEPADVVLDVLGVLVRLLRRIRVVQAEVAFAAEELRHAEVHAHGLRVADVDVAVRFGGEARNNRAAGSPGGMVLLDPLPEEMPARVRFLGFVHIRSRCSGGEARRVSGRRPR